MDIDIAILLKQMVFFKLLLMEWEWKVFQGMEASQEDMACCYDEKETLVNMLHGS